MSKFNFKAIETADKIHIEIVGPIDTECRLPSFGTTKKQILVSFKDVNLINSYGIKNWCKWVIEHKEVPAISLEHCPFVFVKNFASIRGFLGDNMTVRSFYVPFYSDETHESQNILMTVGKDFTPDGFYKIPKAFDSKGKEMEIDVDQLTYFKFLKKP